METKNNPAPFEQSAATCAATKKAEAISEGTRGARGVNHDAGFTAFAPEPMYLLMKHKPSGKELYRILTRKTREDTICTRVLLRSSGDFRYYNFDLLVRRKNNAHQALTIRFLERLEDLNMFFENPLWDVFEYEDEEGELCFSNPHTRILVYFLLSGELPGGKTVCRIGFPTGEDDIENYQTKTPTMIISTEGEGDGSERSELARYLKCPDPDDHRFGPIAYFLALKPGIIAAMY